MVITEEKRILREGFLRKLKLLTCKEIERRSKNVVDNLQKMFWYQKAKVIMGYYPLKGEVDILGMVRKVKEEGKIVCFPKIEGENLVPYVVDEIEKDFKKGKFGIMEPDLEKTQRIEMEEIDVVIIPGVAFDVEKYRLGRGKGFYDRFIRRLRKNIKTIGVAFDFQVVESLPHTSFQDERVNYIVTDTFIL